MMWCDSVLDILITVWGILAFLYFLGVFVFLFIIFRKALDETKKELSIMRR